MWSQLYMTRQLTSIFNRPKYCQIFLNDMHTEQPAKNDVSWTLRSAAEQLTLISSCPAFCRISSCPKGCWLNSVIFTYSYLLNYRNSRTVFSISNFWRLNMQNSLNWFTILLNSPCCSVSRVSDLQVRGRGFEPSSGVHNFSEPYSTDVRTWLCSVMLNCYACTFIAKLIYL